MTQDNELRCPVPEPRRHSAADRVGPDTVEEQISLERRARRPRGVFARITQCAARRSRMRRANLVSQDPGLRPLTRYNHRTTRNYSSR